MGKYSTSDQATYHIDAALTWRNTSP